MSPDDYVRRSAAKILVEQRSIEDPTYRLSDNPDALLQMLGVLDKQNALPPVSIEAALQVPAVLGAVGFLSRTLASLPLHTFRNEENGSRITDARAQLLSTSPNPEWSSYGWRVYHWQQVFTGGRGLSWIERAGPKPVAIWPMDPRQTTIERRGGRKFYRFDGRDYPAEDVIDTPFMLKSDQLGSYSPIGKCNKAISLAIAMGNFAGSFFGGGGIPPLSLEGPLPSGGDAFKRAQADIQRAIELARQAGMPFFGMPPGHSLKPIGSDPDKGQMVEARLFQIQEIARVWGLPPVFVQDLSKGTFTNTEQQDLQLAKHVVTHWAIAFEQELDLKLHGWRNRKRTVKHNIDGLQRGDFKSRTEALARAIQTAQLTPDEARALENRPPKDHGDRLYIQGATVPLGTPPAQAGQNNGPALDKDDGKDPADAGTDE